MYDNWSTALAAVPVGCVFQQEGNKYDWEYDRRDTRVKGIRCSDNSNAIEPYNNRSEVDIILTYSGLIEGVDELPKVFSSFE